MSPEKKNSKINSKMLAYLKKKINVLNYQLLKKNPLSPCYNIHACKEMFMQRTKVWSHISLCYEQIFICPQFLHGFLCLEPFYSLPNDKF